MHNRLLATRKSDHLRKVNENFISHNSNFSNTHDIKLFNVGIIPLVVFEVEMWLNLNLLILLKESTPSKAGEPLRHKWSLGVKECENIMREREQQ